MHRIIFALSLIIHWSFNSIIPDRCQLNWYYLSDQRICVLFGTTHVGDVSWKDASQACEQNSAQLWTRTNSTSLDQIKKKIKEEERYVEILQRGTWIGETNDWSNEDFCAEQTDHLSLLCVVLTIQLDNQTLCLKRISCSENHPFICQTQAMTEDEWENTAMERSSFLRCILSPILCIADAIHGTNDDGKTQAEKAVAEAKKQAQIAAEKAAAEAKKKAEAAQLQGYLGQFETPAPFQTPMPMTESIQQGLLTEQQPQIAALAQPKNSSQIYWIGGGVLLVLVSISCVVIVFVCKKNLSGFIRQEFARAFNETCEQNDQSTCLKPLNCVGIYCLCSMMGKAKDENQPLAFWTGDQCVTCPMDYTTSGLKCYKLIFAKDKQMNWVRARAYCQASGGDLLVIRSTKEFNLISYFIRNSITDDDMLMLTPNDGTRFASVWIGAKLSDSSGMGTYELVSHGPAITKDSNYWCSNNSYMGQEPNNQRLKATGEQQGCLGLAVFSSSPVCMHDWFCSWESYLLCEIHPPPPSVDISVDPGIQPLAAKKGSNKMLYIAIFGIVVILILVIIGVVCLKYRKKKSKSSRQSIDSSMTDLSET